MKTSHKADPGFRNLVFGILGILGILGFGRLPLSICVLQMEFVQVPEKGQLSLVLGDGILFPCSNLI